MKKRDERMDRSRRLELRKEILRNLNSEQLGAVAGGNCGQSKCHDTVPGKCPYSK